MSSSTAATSSAATSTSEPSNPNPALSSSAALYLYTFLATLVLLLSVSAAIVIRSYVIRRRQRLIIEEAIRNGTYIPPQPRRKVDIGKKPVLHDVYLRVEDDEDMCSGDVERGRLKERMIERESYIGEGDSDDDEGDGGHRTRGWWDKVMPVAALLDKPMLDSPSSTPLPSRPHRSWLTSWHRLRGRPAPSPIPTPIPSSPSRIATLSPTPSSPALPSAQPPTPPPPPPTTPDTVQVTFFIAMPSPNHPDNHPHNHGDCIIPHIEFGVASLAMNGGVDEVGPGTLAGGSSRPRLDGAENNTS